MQSPFYPAMGGPYRGKLLEFGESVLAHLPEVGKGSGNPAPKLADRRKTAVLLGKSDLADEHLGQNDVLMAVDIKDTHLLHTVNPLLDDETSEEEKPLSEEVQRMKILSVHDDYEEMVKGRQKELNSLKELGAMTVVKRSEAVGKRVIRTRWGDREKDGRVKSRLVLKNYNRCQGATQPDDRHRL